MEIILGAIGIVYTVIFFILVAGGSIGLCLAMRYHWLRSNGRVMEAERLKEKFSALT